MLHFYSKSRRRSIVEYLIVAGNGGKLCCKTRVGRGAYCFRSLLCTVKLYLPGTTTRYARTGGNLDFRIVFIQRRLLFIGRKKYKLNLRLPLPWRSGNLMHYNTRIFKDSHFVRSSCFSRFPVSQFHASWAVGWRDFTYAVWVTIPMVDISLFMVAHIFSPLWFNFSWLVAFRPGSVQAFFPRTTSCTRHTYM